MELVRLEGFALECEVVGSGEPLLLIHGGFIDTFFPAPAELEIASRYRLISYHRRGYGGSSRQTAPFSIADHAADARALLDHLGIQRAHLAGHSFGGAIATQLSFESPERVGSLALLEPGFIALAPSGQKAVGEIFGAVQALYEKGDRQGAVDAFLTAVAGPDARRNLPPGAFERAVADCDTALTIEQDALQAWTFTAGDLKRIHHPVLAVLGEDSLPVFPEIHAAITRHLPHAEELRIPHTNHALCHMSPVPIAEGMARFLERHPL